ncbi:MAG TPA: hypothetical protein VEW06_06400 [Xanthobacteraceae bacterium]|nr:hypothetical protein [Xanthobacteraceae bacterium]
MSDNDADLREVAVALANNWRDYASDPEQFTLACDDIFYALVTIRNAALATAKFSALVDELHAARAEIELRALTGG